jgi:iron complex transport system substrate-binding protein
MQINNNKKKFTSAVLAAIIAIILSAFTFFGCSSASEKSTAVPEEITNSTKASLPEETSELVITESSTALQRPIEVIDGMGNKIKLDRPAQKIIVYSPALLEIFFGLDAMNTVAEVDSWSVQNNDPLAKGYKGAGDVNGINFEVVTKINPDLVIVVGSSYASNSANDFAKLAQLGFKVYMSNSTSLDGTYSEINNIGKIVGKEKEAMILSSTLKSQVKDIYDKVRDLPQSSKPAVFYMVWNEPLMSAGKNTFVDELITQAGGINIVAKDGLSDWPEYSLEKLVSNNPDVIIAPTSLAANPDIILNDKKFSTIKAVINKKVYSIPDNPISRPNQNVIKGLIMMSEAINPDIFGEFKLIE